MKYFKKKLILGSGSTYRKELLQTLDIPFDVIVSQVDERLFDELFHTAGYEMYTGFLSQIKAHNVATQLLQESVQNAKETSDDIYVLSADQIAIAHVEGRHHLLHKPNGFSEAVEQLMMLRDGTHTLLNALTIFRLHDGSMLTQFDRHTITMAGYSQEQVESYVKEFEPYDCVGGIRIQDDVGFIIATEGSGDDGITGLPLSLTKTMLQSSGFFQ